MLIIKRGLKCVNSKSDKVVCCKMELNKNKFIAISILRLIYAVVL